MGKIDKKQLQKLIEDISNEYVDSETKLRSCIAFIKKICACNGLAKTDVVNYSEISTDLIINITDNIKKHLDIFFREPSKRFILNLGKTNTHNILFMKTKSFSTETNLTNFLSDLKTQYPKNSLIFVLNHFENCLMLLQTDSKKTVTKICFHEKVEDYHINYFENLVRRSELIY